MGNADKFIVGGKTYEVVSPSTFGAYTETIGGACINPNGLANGAIFLAYKGNVQNLYQATSAIAYGANIVENTNCVQTTLKELFASSGGTVSDMTGATAGAAGSHGLVPAPAAGDQGKVLYGDGTWKTPSSGGGGAAADITYDNTSSGLTADDVQDAIDEVVTDLGSKVDSSSLATVATTGDYDDLTDKPSLAAVATSGAYSDLSGTPTLATVATTGDYDDLTDKPSLAAVATSGAYSDLSGTPTLATVATSGDYDDLTDKPTLGTAAAKDSTNAVTQSSTDLVESGAVYTEINTLTTNQGNLADLTTSAKNNLVAAINEAAQSGGGGGGGSSTLAGLTDVSISGLSNGQGLTYDSTATKWKNHTFATVATSGAYSDLSGTPTLATVATSGAYSDLSGAPSLATVATSGDYDDLTNKPTIPAAPSDMTGASSSAAGAHGLVPAPAAGDQGKVLYGDGTWKTPSSGATSAANVTYDNTTSGMTADDVQEAVDELHSGITTLTNTLATKQDATDNTLTTTDKTVSGAINELNSGKADTTTVNNKHKVTRMWVNTSNWSADTTSQSGVTLQKKSVALNNVYVESPSVSIANANGSVLPTTAQQTDYDLVQYVTVDDTVPCLYFYASDVPTTGFWVNVEGVD